MIDVGKNAYSFHSHPFICLLACSFSRSLVQCMPYFAALSLSIHHFWCVYHFHFQILRSCFLSNDLVSLYRVNTISRYTFSVYSLTVDLSDCKLHVIFYFCVLKCHIVWFDIAPQSQSHRAE